MEPVRLGVIGCGVIGNAWHAREAAKSELVDLVAVADLIEDRAKVAAEKYGVPTYYTNEDDLLNDARIEAVTLAMPTGVRTPVAFKALAKGKHVILEKPAASNSAEIEKMISMRGNLVVACCSSRFFAFSEHAEAARKCAAAGVLGKIRSVRFRIIDSAPEKPGTAPPPWRQSMKLNGGGYLVNWSCYDLNYMMEIVGWRLKPRVLLAKWWPIAGKMSAYVAAGSDADSHHTAFILCDDGIVLTMERGEFTSAAPDRAWEIIGEEGTLHLQLSPEKGKPNTVILDKFVPGKGVVSEVIWQKDDDKPSDDMLKNFIYAIREGKEVKTSLERALVMQKITDAIYASAKLGQAVTIS